MDDEAYKGGWIPCHQRSRSQIVFFFFFLIIFYFSFSVHCIFSGVWMFEHLGSKLNNRGKLCTHAGMQFSVHRYVELSDRAMGEWAEQSGVFRNKNYSWKHCNATWPQGGWYPGLLSSEYKPPSFENPKVIEIVANFTCHCSEPGFQHVQITLVFRGDPCVQRFLSQYGAFGFWFVTGMILKGIQEDNCFGAFQGPKLISWWLIYNSQLPQIIHLSVTG